MFVRATGAALALTLLAAIAACSSSSTGANGPTSPPAPSVPPASSSAPASGPVSSGPTTAAVTRACPLLTQAFVAGTLGMRQGRITVLRSGGKVVGCRFYASQVEPLHTSEHLPGPEQAVAEVTTRRYATAVAAHNAFVLASRAGAEASRATIDSGVVGVTYRTRFDPTDGARDWACGYSIGTTAVLIRAAEDDSADEVASLARTVLHAIR